MKNVFKVLFALFLINSAGLCGAQQDDTVPWYNRIGSFVNRNFLNEDEQAENAVGGVDEAEDATGGVDEAAGDLCWLCRGEFTEAEPVYKKLMNNTCVHQKLHKKCSSNKVCFDDECCLHAAIRDWAEKHNSLVQCPYKCENIKIDNLFVLLPILVELSPEERLAEKKRLLLIKFGRILRVGTYSAMFIQNCREKDRFQAAVKMLTLSILMFGDKIIEKALNTIRVSGVTTLKQKLEIIKEEFLKNIFHMVSTCAVPGIFAGIIKVEKLDNVPYIVNQLFVRLLCSFPTDLYDVATGYNQDIRDKLFEGLQMFKSISSVVLNTSIAGSLLFKLNPMPYVLTRKEIIDQLHLVNPSLGIHHPSFNTMVDLWRDISDNQRYKKSLKNLQCIAGSFSLFAVFEGLRLNEINPLFARNR